MNTKYTKEYQNNKYQMIYSLRIRTELSKKGFEPLVEMDNMLKPPLKCWKFLNTVEFAQTLSEIMKGGKQNA